jgi:hypothetical protein
LQKETDETFAELERDVREELGLAPVAQKKKTLSTILSRNAVSALSRPSKPASRLAPVSRKPPAKSTANPALLQARKIRPAAPITSATAPVGSQRFASATAASRSTLGYAQGRAVSQKVRRPITSVFRDTNGAERSASDNQILKDAGNVVERLRMADLGLDDHDDDEDSLFGHESNIVPGIDDEFDDFQFPLPAA